MRVVIAAGKLGTKGERHRFEARDGVAGNRPEADLRPAEVLQHGHDHAASVGRGADVDERAAWASWSPCEKFSRNTSTPAPISARNKAGAHTPAPRWRRSWSAPCPAVPDVNAAWRRSLPFETRRVRPPGPAVRNESRSRVTIPDRGGLATDSAILRLLRFED